MELAAGGQRTGKKLMLAMPARRRFKAAVRAESCPRQPGHRAVSCNALYACSLPHETHPRASMVGSPTADVQPVTECPSDRYHEGEEWQYRKDSGTDSH